MGRHLAEAVDEAIKLLVSGKLLQTQAGATRLEIDPDWNRPKESNGGQPTQLSARPAVPVREARLPLTIGFAGRKGRPASRRPSAARTEASSAVTEGLRASAQATNVRRSSAPHAGSAAMDAWARKARTHGTREELPRKTSEGI